MPSQQPNYKKSISEVMLDLFRDSFKNGPFKEFREGDPIIFPASMLPALFISEPVTEYSEGPTGFDKISHQILIQLVFNKKDEFGAPQGVATLDQTMDRYVHGRDATTGDLTDNSILGVLRRHYTFNGMIIHQEARVEKYTLPRSQELWTTEAQVRITVEEEQAISSRS